MNKKIQKIIPLSLGVLVLSLFAAYLLHAVWEEPTLPPPQGQVEIRATAMATTTGTPIPADCDEAAERGRVRIDPATDRQYICGNLGWAFLAAAPTHHTLTVTTTGSGTVTSSPAGINCPGDCTEVYAYGTSVTLTASPAVDWVFGGWGGACTGTGDCIVSMTEARTVQATFLSPPTAYFLFDTAVTSDGHLGEEGGRAGADAMCAADADRPTDDTGNLICTYYWAFISVNANDRVLDFPNTIPGRSGVAWNPNANWYFRDGAHAKALAGVDFDAILDHSVDNAPNVGGVDGSYYWTGSFLNGTLAFKHCLGWVSSASNERGHKGYNLRTTWLGWEVNWCNTSYTLLCACF